MVQQYSPKEIRKKMSARETFVVNIVAAWCPDCTERQQPHFPGFVEKMKAADVPVYQCMVQEEKLVFISADHEALTSDFGGHGYPRTVLIVDGEMTASRVEVMDALALMMLADEYVGQVRRETLQG